MSARIVRVCPACRRASRSKPLPPDGFWQVQVLQRIGMYPYRCEACGARFYRKVPVGEGMGASLDAPHAHGPGKYAGEGLAPSQSPKRTVGEGLAPSREPRVVGDGIPQVVAPPEATDSTLSHEDFVDLIDHISRSEQRKGLKIPEKDDEKE